MEEEEENSVERVVGERVIYGSGIVEDHGTKRYLSGFGGGIALFEIEQVAASEVDGDDDVGGTVDVEGGLTDCVGVTDGQEIVGATVVAEVTQVLSSEELEARVVSLLELYLPQRKCYSQVELMNRLRRRENLPMVDSNWGQ